MAVRGKEMMKRLVKKLKAENIKPDLEKLKAWNPDSKVIMGRAKRGLYAGRHIQFGNRISEDSGNKSRRTWKPNVQEKRLFSYIFDTQIKLRVTTHALHCIDKAGGLDEYLLKTPYDKMDSETGLYWKTKVEQKYAEASRMGTPLFTQEDEAKFQQRFKGLNIANEDAKREARRRKLFGKSGDNKVEEEAAVEGGSSESQKAVDHGSLEATA